MSLPLWLRKGLSCQLPGGELVPLAREETGLVKLKEFYPVIFARGTPEATNGCWEEFRRP